MSDLKQEQQAEPHFNPWKPDMAKWDCRTCRHSVGSALYLLPAVKNREDGTQKTNAMSRNRRDFRDMCQAEGALRHV